MSEELLVSRVKAALDVAPADPALRARVIQSLPLNRRQAGAPRWSLAPAIAGLLTIAVVAGLVWANRFETRPGVSLPQVSFSACQLPVWGFGPYDPSTASLYQVGFLEVSTGRFTPAPSTIASPGEALPVDATGSRAISYDRAARTWVPVRPSWISPDGMSYVYLSGHVVHITYVRSQSDRVLLSGQQVAILIGWSGGLIYYSTRQASSSDLWALDPATGKTNQVAPMQPGSEWWYAAPDAIWGSAYYTGKIARYDTKTHLVSAWALDGLVDMIGVDSSGNAIVLRGDFMAESGQVAIMHGNGSATLLDAAGEVFKPTDITVVADGERTWFSADGQRLWVYSADTGLLLLDQASNRSLPSGLVVAGGCVSKAEVSLGSSAAP